MKTYSFQQLKLNLLSIINFIKECNDDFYNKLRLIIIDSISPLIISSSIDYDNKNSNISYQNDQYIQLSELLHELCNNYSISVVVYLLY